LPLSTAGVERNDDLIDAIRKYWNERIHDLEIARHPVGSREFFEELAAYRYEKLDYLPRVVDFAGYRGKKLLEIGCGVGLDLARFARGGADVTGVDLAEVAINLAKKNFAIKKVTGDLEVMNGERLEFGRETFDIVYAHGVLQYTADIRTMLREIRRVLKPEGEAILMVYNRYSWLNGMSKLFGVELEHQDAPVLNTFSIGEFRKMLRQFTNVEIIPERFPVPTRLHRGVKAAVYNVVFVSAFNALPRSSVRPFGWHLLAKAVKAPSDLL
jgi:2-polyprenyl-3-methyl-5-hydroxy-6-metoxy-1,4-benzoquinol methylase